MKSLANRISELLARRPGLKPAGLSRIAGVSTATVSDWMTGETKSMKPEPARRISIEFGCDQNWLMTGVGSANWREPGQNDLGIPAPLGGGTPPTIRQALIAIRNHLAHAHGDTSEAVGEALRLMAKVPDSDRAFDEALSLIEALASVHKARSK